MEWVETTARTVEEAKDLLLDQLGVDDQEAEFDIIEEPKPGLFGRLRGNARVRARVAPKAPRAKDERRNKPSNKKNRSRNSNKSAASTQNNAASNSPNEKKDANADGLPKRTHDKQAPAAGKQQRNDASDKPTLSVDDAQADVTEFLTKLLNDFGVDGTVSIDVSEDAELMVHVEGQNLGRLIGPKGTTMVALEELCRTRLQHRAAGGNRPRMRLDVAKYRESRKQNLIDLVDTVIDDVSASGTERVIDVVTAHERKTVHDRVNDSDKGVLTESRGQDPRRRVAILPNSGSAQ